MTILLFFFVIIQYSIVGVFMLRSGSKKTVKKKDVKPIISVCGFNPFDEWFTLKEDSAETLNR
jgi:hypothetical protein